MFEQSMLLDDAPSKKAGAVAVSLTVQTVFVGTLVLIPLMYNERLPFLQPTPPTYLQITAPLPPAPAPVDHVPPTGSSRPHTNARPFVLVHNSSRGVAESVATIAEPGVDVAFGPYTGPLVPTIMPSVIVPPPPPVVTVVETVRAKPVRLSTEILASKLVHKVVPAYPRLAIATRVSGTVKLVGVIAKDGSVQQLQVLSGHPLLTQAALEAVRQWIYTPTMLNGKTVEVSAPIDVIFTLAQ